MLHKEEWLKDAQALPIGRCNRVYHGAEHRPNLVVWNLEDRWSAYCHACKEGAVLKKDFVKIKNEPVKKYHADARSPGTLFDLYDAMNVPVQEVIEFCTSKNMWIDILKQYNPLYSPQDKRIVFSTPQGLIGRDITGTAKAKWYTYNPKMEYASPYNFTRGKHLILVEDYFSALKGNFYATESELVFAMLGCELRNSLATLCLQSSFVTILCDADKAGYAAAPKIAKRLELINVPHRVLFPTDGLDPKDEGSSEWITNFLKL